MHVRVSFGQDTQVLRVTLQIENAYIFTCDSITAIKIMEGFNNSLESMESMLLPFTGECSRLGLGQS